MNRKKYLLESIAPRLFIVVALIIFFTPGLLLFYTSILPIDLSSESKTLWKDVTSVEGAFIQRSPTLQGLDRIRSWVRYHILNLAPNERLYMGIDGWMFRLKGQLKVEHGETSIPPLIQDHIGKAQFTDEELKVWARVLDQRYNYLKERGIPYIFTIAPRKSVIYPEMFPEKVRHQFALTRADQLIEYLKENAEVPLVDLSKYLLKAKQNQPNLYFKTDGHWNILGAYWAYRGITDGVLHHYPDIEITPVTLDQFELHYEKDWYHKTFESFAGIRIKEPYPYLLPMPNNPIAKIPVYQTLKGWTQNHNEILKVNRVNQLQVRGLGRVGRTTTTLKNIKGEVAKYTLVKNPEASELDSILIKGDSFTQRLIYFFAAHAQNTIRHREIFDFNLHPLELAESDLAEISLVIQEVGHGALGRSLPVNPWG